jgi:hypothetical protein
MNDIAPKYLSEKEINISQIGLFGYITEVLSVLSEDSINATSIVFKECFANAAENIESLYKMASIYQLDSYFAKAATMQFVLIIDEDDIIDNGVVNGNIIKFCIDSNTQFFIDNIPFKLEYDIQILSKKVNVNGYEHYIHNATYIMDNPLSFAFTTNKFIKSKVIKYNNQNFVSLLINLRQMEMNVFEEVIVNNDKINKYQFDFQIDDSDNIEIAGFEAFYQSPVATENSVQLIKKMENTPKLKNPFCFYSMPGKGLLKITFSNDQNYFVPEFNSNLTVNIYTTRGKAGNFNKYDGDDIRIITTPDKYAENSGLILFGQCYGSSQSGKDSPTLEEFRDIIVAAQSTVLSYTTDNDLKLFFESMTDAGNSEIMFIKRRDDILFRLFSAFILFRDNDGVIMPTNTCDLFIEEKDIDVIQGEDYRGVIKAGRLLEYVKGSKDKLKFLDEVKIEDSLDIYEDTYLYTLPFLTILSTNPTGVELYLNSIDHEYKLDTEENNNDSLIQFIVNGLQITRNSLTESKEKDEEGNYIEDGKYEISLRILPSTETIDIISKQVKDDTDLEGVRTFVSTYDDKTYTDEGIVKVIIAFETDNIESCYMELFLSDIKNDNSGEYFYDFKNYLYTDDYVNTKNKMRVKNSVKNMKTGEPVEEWFIPSNNLIINVYIFYKYSDDIVIETSLETINTSSHKFDIIDEAKGFTLTNIYSTKTENVDLIKPLDMIKCRLDYNYDVNNQEMYNYNIFSVPVVKANYIKTSDNFEKIVSSFSAIYEYLNSGLDKLTNNFNIDIKFYNTYGKSRHYIIDASAAEIEMYRIQRTSYVDPNLLEDKESDIAKVYVDPNKIFEYENEDIYGNISLFLDKVHLTLNFDIKPYFTTDTANLVDDVKNFILKFMKSNFDAYGNNSYFNSNLMKQLEVEFADKIEYIIFRGINDYPLKIQRLEPIIDESNIRIYYEKMLDYVPEYLNIHYKITNGTSTPSININIID